jgi:hypothetical protein
MKNDHIVKIRDYTLEFFADENIWYLFKDGRYQNESFPDVKSCKTWLKEQRMLARG